MASVRPSATLSHPVRIRRAGINVSTTDQSYEHPSDRETDGNAEAHNTEPPPKRRRVYVEEVPDEGEPQLTTSATHGIERHPAADWWYDGRFPTSWEARWNADRQAGREAWEPFEDLDDWELGKWLMMSGASQEMIDKFLKLSIVSKGF